MGRIFCAPLFYVGFADFWLADQLNSLNTVFLDFQYFVCFYVKNSSWTQVEGHQLHRMLICKFVNNTELLCLIFPDAETCIIHEHSLRPFVVCLPAWFRFAQCLRRYRDTKEAFPHLANASKYATSFFVVAFSYLHLANSSKNWCSRRSFLLPKHDFPSIYTLVMSQKITKQRRQIRTFISGLQRV